MFHEAVVHAYEGKKIQRKGWAPDHFVSPDPMLIKSLKKEEQTRPKLTEWEGQMMGLYRPEVPDMLARDWVVIENIVG